MAFIDKMMDHAGTMKEWFKEPGSELFFEWLALRRAELVNQLVRESLQFTVNRLQGQIEAIDRIMDLPGLINKRLKDVEQNRNSNEAVKKGRS